MRNDSSQNDPRKVWQAQPTEPSMITLEKIRRKVRDLNAKTRRQLLGSVAVLLFVAVFYAFGVKQFPTLRLPFALPIAWSALGLYFLNRGMWPQAMPGDAALSTGLEFYRHEIQRRRDLLRRTLLWSFAPIVLAIATFLLAVAKLGDKSLFPNALPFMTLVVVWIVAYFVIRLRERRDLQREIDELNNLEA
ncbi:MAG: hypothetical protein ABI693_23525 [Bryobacteraceae bacterium]